MSSRSSWSDAQIHAYVDGELDAAAAARLEADSRVDAALAAHIAEQRGLRARLHAELDPVLEEPLPQRLSDALSAAGHGGGVTPIGAARRAHGRAPWSLREWIAVAATLVIGVLVGVLASRSSGGLPFELDQGRLVAADYLDTALSTQLSGGAPQRARIGMSFRAAAGEYCRTFTIQAGAGGFACRRDGRWSVEFLDAAAAQPAPTEDFRQASSALSPAMVGAIAALGAGDPLTADEERRQLESGWERPATEPGR